MTSSDARLPGFTYLAIMGLLTSIGALATDIMLPALGVLGQDLGVGDINQTLVVMVFFLGMALGQLVVGPLSDAYGRKRVIIWGYALFIAGCGLSMLAGDWWLMVAARFLRVSAPRTACCSSPSSATNTRDAPWRGSCRSSWQSSSWPRSSPLMGQGLIYLGGWRATLPG